MRKRFKHRKPQHEDMELQITSMADIFTVVLIFLLKSYASGAIEIAPSPGIQLPVAHGQTKPLQTLRLEVSDSAVLLDGSPVAKMSAYRFAESDLGEAGASRALQAALQQTRAREAKTLGATPESPKQADSRIVVIADQRAPYQTIKTVLASAASEGYTDVKLAVSHDE